MASVVAVWSTKGGVGVTAVSAMLAMGQVERAEETLLVDLCGDLPALFGVPEPDGPGLTDWCAMPDPSPEALGRIEVDVRSGLGLLPRGTGDFEASATTLLSTLDTSTRKVIVDCGLLAADELRRDIVEQCDVRLLVVRPCFLALRSAQNSPVLPTGVVVVNEPGRSLGLGDIESTIDAPVVAQIAVDQSIARCIDAGVLATRLPRRLVRAMGQALEHAA